MKLEKLIAAYEAQIAPTRKKAGEIIAKRKSRSIKKAKSKSKSKSKKNQ
jgi:hypothetical protein